MNNNIIVKDLKNLRRSGHLGLYKKGLALSKSKYNLICDYLEKVNYSLQDIERELNKGADNSVLISIIVYVSWIQESVDEIKKSYKLYVFDDFIFDTMRIDMDKKFLNAIRSFVFAHPLTTNRHSAFGFDGTLRCVDIQPFGSNKFFVFTKSEDKYYIDLNGRTEYSNQVVDYWLYVYNDNKYDNCFKQFIGISLETICSIANDYVDYICALDRHLSRTNIRKTE